MIRHACSMLIGDLVTLVLSHALPIYEYDAAVDCSQDRPSGLLCGHTTRNIFFAIQ